MNPKIYATSAQRSPSLLALLVGIFVAVGCYRSAPEREDMAELPDDSDELPPIHQAAEEGDMDRLRVVLNEDPSLVNATNFLDNTPLHLASTQGHTAIVAELLDRGADPNRRGFRGMLPLHCALKYKHREVVELLLGRGADVDAVDDQGWHAIDYIASDPGEDAERIYRLMIDYGVKTDIFTEMSRGNCQEVRQYFQEHPEMVGSLAKERRENLISLTMYMLWQRYVRIENSLDPYTSLQDKAKLLQRIIDENRDILDLLINQGAPRRVAYETFHEHLQTANVELVRLMLEYGAQVSPPPGRDEILTHAETARYSPRAPEMLALLREYKVIE